MCIVCGIREKEKECGLCTNPMCEVCARDTWGVCPPCDARGIDYVNPPVRSLDAFRSGTLQRGAATGAADTKGEFQAGSTWSVGGGSVGLLSSDVNPNASPQEKVEEETRGGCDLSPMMNSRIGTKGCKRKKRRVLG